MEPVASHPPPPKRLVPAKPPADPLLPPEKQGWFKRQWNSWGESAMYKGIALSDNVGTRVNGWAEGVRPRLSLPLAVMRTRRRC